MSETNGSGTLDSERLRFPSDTLSGLALNKLVANLVTERRELLRQFNDRGTRDIEAECGYPTSITVDEYWNMFRRKGVGKRVTNIYARECWKAAPDIYEQEDVDKTPFELGWKSLVREQRILSYLQRVDELAGVGRFGLLILGFGDGRTLDKPAPGLDETGKPTKPATGTKLLYLKPVAENKVRLQASNIQKDQRNPRYGLPVTYKVRLGDETNPDAETTVHWTRVIHVAHERTDSEVYGTPSMEDVWDYLLDLKKIGGSSAEMFYKGGFPGLATKALPGIEGMDTAAAKKQLEDYQEGLQRIIALFGVEVQSLAANIADPTAHAMLQLQLICIAKGVPMRVFMGSERGELASSQDAKAWNERLADRRDNYLSPFVIRPLVDRLVHVGVLEPPKPDETNPELLGYEVEWPDPNALSKMEQADLGAKLTEAMGNYVQKGVNQIAGTQNWMVHILGVEEEVAQVLVDEIGDVLDQEDLDAKAMEEAEAAFGAKEPTGDEE